jgi:hypothetical protein
VAGCDFRYLTGPSSTTLSGSEDRNRWIHADFRVRADDFRTALDELATEPL